MINKSMYALSRIYGRYGMKAQKYAMVDPRGLPGKLKFQWHVYRVTLVLILVFVLMLFLQDMVIFFGAFAATIVALYMKGIFEEKLDDGIARLMNSDRQEEPEEEKKDDREQHPV